MSKHPKKTHKQHCMYGSYVIYKLQLTLEQIKLYSVFRLIWYIRFISASYILSASPDFQLIQCVLYREYESKYMLYSISVAIYLCDIVTNIVIVLFGLLFDICESVVWLRVEKTNLTDPVNRINANGNVFFLCVLYLFSELSCDSFTS